MEKYYNGHNHKSLVQHQRQIWIWLWLYCGHTAVKPKHLKHEQQINRHEKTRLSSRGKTFKSLTLISRKKMSLQCTSKYLRNDKNTQPLNLDNIHYLWFISEASKPCLRFSWKESLFSENVFFPLKVSWGCCWCSSRQKGNRFQSLCQETTSPLEFLWHELLGSTRDTDTRVLTMNNRDEQDTTSRIIMTSDTFSLQEFWESRYSKTMTSLQQPWQNL